jgi:hypothetical protein
MATSEILTLEGMYHDVLRDPRGGVIWDRGWRKNAIVVNCRRLLASFLAERRFPDDDTRAALGISGLSLGAGLETWDQTPPAAPDPSRTGLVDQVPFVLDRDDLQIDFLDGGNVTTTPTNRLQIFARLGQNKPSWPNASHLTSSLREFGLVGSLDGQPVLLNYVIHPVITKDPFSTLERTIWLVF